MLFGFKNIKITGIASAVPTQIVTGDSFYDRFGEDVVRKFQEATGVIQFHKAKEHQTASDLCFVSAEKILDTKGINHDEIDALVFIAHSTDYRRPATACVLHKRLGLKKDCVAFDVNLGCSAFVYGVNIVCSLMQSSNMNKALLLCGETLSKMTNPQDKSVAMLFGDGGAAILFEKTFEESDIYGLLRTDGNGYKAIIAPAGGFRNMHAPTKDFVWSNGNIRSLYNTTMQGEDVFSFSITDVPRAIKDFLKETNSTVEDYDCFAFHQANKFISHKLCKKLNIPPEKMPLCLDRYGNASAPAIPMVMCDKYGDDTESRELNFLMCGFGVGLSWGVCSARVNVSDIMPIIETDNFFEEGVINKPEDLEG